MTALRLSSGEKDRSTMQNHLSFFVLRALSALGIAAIVAACSGSGSSWRITPSGVTTDSQTRPAPPKGAAFQAKPAASAISNNVHPAVCPPPSGYIFPRDPTIKRYQRKTLYSFRLTWRWVDGKGCVGSSPAVDATWQSSGGHLSSMHGKHVEFFAGKPNAYTVTATAILFKAQDTVTVKN